MTSDQTAPGSAEAAAPSVILPAATPEPLRRNGPFTRYLGGFGLSLLGDQIWFVALGWAASRLDTPLQTSLVMAFATVPRAVLLLLGGTLADRHGALRVALASQSLRAAVMAVGTLAVLATGSENITVLLAISVIFGALDAAHMPAAAALPPYLLAKTDLPAGQGAVQTLERTATIAGAPLGGFIVATGGLSAATAVNAAFFVMALIILRSLRTRIPSAAVTPTADPETAWQSLRGGLRYVTTEPTLWRILFTVTVLNLALAAPLNVGIALLASERRWSASSFSLILMGFAAGAVIGAVSVAARRSQPRTPAAAGLRWAAAGSLGVATIPLFPQLPATIAAASFLGLTTGPAGALLLGMIQAKTESDYLGRVMALVTFSALGLMPVSIAVFGVLTDALGVTGAFLACAAALALSASLAYANRAVRTAALDAPEATDS